MTTREVYIEAVPWLGKDRGPEFNGAVTVILILATLTVILRFIARRVSRSPYGYDDWLVLVALVMNLSLLALEKGNS